MSLSLNKLENDLWLRLVELKCQTNFLQQIRSIQRNYFISLNEQFQRRVKNSFFFVFKSKELFLGKIN
jgi:hypothetical protein